MLAKYDAVKRNGFVSFIIAYVCCVLIFELKCTLLNAESV